MSALGFYDSARQPGWVDEEADFLIGDYGDGDGGVDPDGEFVVRLIRLNGDSPSPHLEAFGDGVGSLKRAIEAGLLGQLGEVADHVEFSRRLLKLGFEDLSTEPLPTRDWLT